MILFFLFFFEFDKTRKMRSLNIGFKGDGFIRTGKKNTCDKYL